MSVERVADDGERRAVLLALQALMGSIGSANDAEDHGYLAEAERIRTESCTAVRDLVAHHRRRAVRRLRRLGRQGARLSEIRADADSVD